jgi:adenylosuccinate lyase
MAPAYENIALWHERDISHSSVERVLLPDAFIGCDYLLHLTQRVLKDLEVDPARMRANMEASRGLYFSQRALLALTNRLGSREEAYAIVQSAAHEAWRQQRSFRDLLREETRGRDLLEDAELEEICDADAFLRNLEPIFERVLSSRWARLAPAGSDGHG